MAGPRNRTGTNILDFAPIVGGGISGVIEAISGSGDRKRRREIYNMLLGELGQPALTDTDISGLMEGIRRQMGPALAGTAQSASQRLGLDSGAAQGELARSLLGGQQQALTQFNLEKIRLNNEKRMQLLRSLTEVGLS